MVVEAFSGCFHQIVELISAEEVFFTGKTRVRANKKA
jgi:hypothetical protein